MISCQWSYRLNDVQALAFHGGSSSAWCTRSKFSPGALRRTWMFFRQGDFWGRQEGAGRGVHCPPFQAVSKTLACSLQPSLVFFQLAFSAWLHRAHILYFRCMGWGGGNKCFSFSFNFLASHWTFIFISWVAYMQLLWLDPVRHLSAIARACTLNHKRKIKAAISYFHKWKDVSSIGRHWKKFCSLKILQLNY